MRVGGWGSGNEGCKHDSFVLVSVLFLSACRSQQRVQNSPCQVHFVSVPEPCLLQQDHAAAIKSGLILDLETRPPHTAAAAALLTKQIPLVDERSNHLEGESPTYTV